MKVPPQLDPHKHRKTIMRCLSVCHVIYFASVATGLGVVYSTSAAVLCLGSVLVLFYDWDH